MRPANIYLCGVGGQGIGLLSEVMIRACLAAGYQVMGCDTHGLAQRGGIVESHLRIGRTVFTPLVPPGQADLVIAMERLEALRGTARMLRRGGALIWYDTGYPSLPVRQGRALLPGAEDVGRAVADRGGSSHRVRLDALPDPRMQNVALLGRLAGLGLIDGVTREVVAATLGRSVPAHARAANLEVFERAAADGLQSEEARHG